jgi:hypothetical protein
MEDALKILSWLKPQDNGRTSKAGGL